MRGKVLALTPAEVVARARSLCVVPSDPASRIYYSSKTGRNGGADPEAITCASLWRDKADGGRLWLTSDCVGLAMWAYGCDRYQPPLWVNQNALYREATAGRGWRFCDPYPGCLALIRGPIPGDKRVGHMAVVTEIRHATLNGDQQLESNGAYATHVVHCSGSGKRRHGQAIGEDPIGLAMGTSRPVYFVERVPG